MTEATIRIGGRAGYCSGILIAPDLRRSPAGRTRFALTCAHFFHTDRAGTEVRGRAFHTRLEAVQKIPWSDLAVVRLAGESPVRELPAVAKRRAPLLRPAITHGYGGHQRSSREKPGRVIGWVPLAVSRELQTFVRSGAVVWNNPAAIRGDSGGPVIAGGRVVALQSLIMNPFGVNLHIATTSQLAPHRRAILRAVRELS